MDTVLRVLWALFMLYVAGKVLLLLRRFARRAYPAGDRAPDPMEPLPSQEKDLVKLAGLISPVGDEAGRVVPLRGRWGEGKSFLLRLLKERWDPDPRAPALVIVDVWQQETEADLQVSIIEAVLSHPSYLGGLRWWKIPIGFMFARPIARLRDSVRSVQVKMLESGAANVEAELQLPRVSWQGLFERLTQGATRCRTVIALDEADRATPTVTQAALTLARRSADSPRVTVLLPYIQPLIRYKTFNPLLATGGGHFSPGRGSSSSMASSRAAALRSSSVIFSSARTNQAACRVNSAMELRRRLTVGSSSSHSTPIMVTIRSRILPTFGWSRSAVWLRSRNFMNACWFLPNSSSAYRRTNSRRVSRVRG
jgi:hypothetical protein